MATPNGPRSQRSDFDLFLFAGIGTEPNGSTLTVLSLLARLGSDPWLQAQRLAGLPAKSAADWLAERIATTPLAAESWDHAHRTAEGLVALLPAQTGPARVAAVLPLDPRAASPSVPFGETPAMRWTFLAVIWTVLALGLASGALYENKSTQKPPPAPTIQGTQ